jgi:hypothetical protein
VTEPKDIQFKGEVGCRVSHGEAERISKQKIMLRALDWMPLGSRLIVVKDPVPEKIGSIILSINERDMHSMGTGWIIAAGPDAGKIHLAPIGNLAVQDPRDLLGLHVMFGVHAGKVMRFSVFDDSEYKSEILVISPVDVWAIDTNPAGAKMVEEFEEMFAATRAGEEEAAREAEAEAARKIEEDRAAGIAAQEAAAREGDERAAAIITGQEGSDD